MNTNNRSRIELITCGLRLFADLLLLAGISRVASRAEPNGKELPSDQLLKTADYYARMIQHEGNLINHRLTWLVGFNAFLFAGVAFAWERAYVLIVGLVLLGVLTSSSAYSALHAAGNAMNDLNNGWKAFKGSALLPVIGRETKCKVVKMLYPWYALPIVLIAAWMAIGVVAYPSTRFERLRAWGVKEQTNPVALTSWPTNALPFSPLSPVVVPTPGQGSGTNTTP